MSNVFRLFVPEQAVGASLVYFDLFNATGSAHDLILQSVLPIVSGAVAVSGLVAVDLNLTRTTAIGTTGTAATNEGTSLTAATFTNLTGICPPPNGITARLTPGGGATAGAVISRRSVYTEEANAGTYVPTVDMVAPCPSLAAQNDGMAFGILVPQNSGIRVIQGGVASVGNIGFDVIFRVRPKA
jgi:hypothetical protein